MTLTEHCRTENAGREEQVPLGVESLVREEILFYDLYIGESHG